MKCPRCGLRMTAEASPMVIDTNPLTQHLRWDCPDGCPSLVEEIYGPVRKIIRESVPGSWAELPFAADERAGGEKV